MPAGPTLIGFGAFVAVKGAGYLGAAAGLRKVYDVPAGEQPSTFRVGLARTLLGMAVGIPFGALFFVAFSEAPPWWFYLGLFPVRMAEWVALLWFFFDPLMQNKVKLVGWSLAGSAWSYLLDLGAVLAAFIVPGGAWVC